MSIVQVRAAGQASSRRPVTEVWQAVDTVPAMTSLIAAVQECEPIDGGWRWDLGQRGALGLSVPVVFDVVTMHQPPVQIVFTPIGQAGAWAAGEGRVRLTARGEATEIDVAVDLDLDLTAPRMLTKPLGRIIQREVQATVDDFLRRWVAQVGG